MHRAVGLAIVSIVASGAAGAEKSRFAVGGSDAQYVHRIHLYDADKQQIDPTSATAKPYSPMATCGKCHAYDEIAHGLHFNALAGGDAGRPGEPWIYFDARTGTQVPLSYRDWPGVFKPAAIDLSTWDFTLRFGRHFPGGGPGEAAPIGDERTPAADADARWNVAGKLAIDCMACHAGDRAWSQEAWAEQIAGQNFAWASTAAYGLGSVADRVSRLPKDFDPSKPVEGESAPKLPAVRYDANRFDAEGRFFFDVVRRPSNNQCMQCHTTRHSTGEKWLHEQDVHIASGMSCVDCHRNGIDHHSVRGYVGEKHPTGADVASFSCVGCHVDGVDGQGGRLGSPRPKHAGIPPIHFERMSCTSCHSGPLPGDAPMRVQTSLAHALGLPEQRSFAEPPEIVEPVFMKSDGMVTPHRMMWPAYWGVRGEDGKIAPMDPERAYAELRRVLRVRKDFRDEVVGAALSDEDRKSVLGPTRGGVDDAELTVDERAALATFAEGKAKVEFRGKIGEALRALAKSGEGASAGKPVYVARGKVYQLSASGEAVETVAAAEAGPVAWALGHNVRPARQSLGVRGCLECHAAGSAMFYGEVAAVGPAADTDPATFVMHERIADDAALVAGWERLFAGRYMLKVMGMSVLAIVLLITLAHAGAGLVAVSRRLGARNDREDL